MNDIYFKIIILFIGQKGCPLRNVIEHVSGCQKQISVNQLTNFNGVLHTFLLCEVENLIVNSVTTSSENIS